MLLHATTLLARSGRSIASYLRQLPDELRAQPILFTLSSNASKEFLSTVVHVLDSHSNSQSVGCVSAALPLHSSVVACSLAFFDRATAVPFRSTIQGRVEPQVGRWHAMRAHQSPSSANELDVHSSREEAWKREVDAAVRGQHGDIDWDRIWSGVRDLEALPPPLKLIRKQEVHTVISFTDSAFQGFANALEAFPQANKLSLVASSTPFSTGLPFTLIENSSLHSSGAVGIALTSGRRPSLMLQYPGLEEIAPPMTVTASDGNLIHGLDGSNPTKMLMSAIEQQKLSGDEAKDDEFCLMILKFGMPWEVHRIMAGGPSRGIMALESEIAPAEGAIVQLCHRPRDKVPNAFMAPPTDRAVTFVNTASDLSSTPQSDLSESDVHGFDEVFGSTFLSASENGFIVGRSKGVGSEGNSPWKSSVTGGRATLNSWE
ncbi:hypothetical protein FA95DRAFT_1538192 [Auriscalpium vulgare]|uniref:Uncharacterized protein n=1 Tax=Auriscalpium vulgare TaxID=40419 RepID=A0ACB8RZT8_9AGAM|nr:hypothetical protein FA95DRAFT_1538192 [Auriscalpium vulgare]